MAHVIKADGHRFEIMNIGNIGIAIYIFVAITIVRQKRADFSEDLELASKVFFFADSCISDLAFEESK